MEIKGSGAFSTVYKIVEKTTNRMFAGKKIRLNKGKNLTTKQAAERELSNLRLV